MARSNTVDLNKIPLGSGNVYVVEWNGEVPTEAELEVEDNLIGRTKNGATVTYSSEYYRAYSDDGVAIKNKLVTESATLSYGMITWYGETLKKLIGTARLYDQTGSTAGGFDKYKIGGIDNDNNTSYLLRFVHDDPIDGTIKITMVGKNTGGWSAAFAPSSETILQPTFEAEPLDEEGTLIEYWEERATTSST